LHSLRRSKDTQDFGVVALVLKGSNLTVTDSKKPSIIYIPPLQRARTKVYKVHESLPAHCTPGQALRLSKQT
jgi:hypothetical protein